MERQRHERPAARIQVVRHGPGHAKHHALRNARLRIGFFLHHRRRQVERIVDPLADDEIAVLAERVEDAAAFLRRVLEAIPRAALAPDLVVSDEPLRLSGLLLGVSRFVVGLDLGVAVQVTGQVFLWNLVFDCHFLERPDAPPGAPEHVVHVVEVGVDQQVVDRVVEAADHANRIGAGSLNLDEFRPEDAHALHQPLVDELLGLPLEVEFVGRVVQVAFEQLPGDIAARAGLGVGLRHAHELRLLGREHRHVGRQAVGVGRQVGLLVERDGADRVSVVDDGPEDLDQLEDLVDLHPERRRRDGAVVALLSARIGVLPHPVVVAVIEHRRLLRVVGEGLLVFDGGLELLRPRADELPKRTTFRQALRRHGRRASG